MKIAYACFWDGFASDGVTAKIRLQMKAWRQAGHEVQLFCISPAPKPGATPTLEGNLFTFSGRISRVGATLRMSRAVGSFRPDLLYLRSDIFLPPLGRLLRRFPSVVELNASTLPTEGTRRPLVPYYLFSRRVQISSAAGLVPVCHEAATIVAPFGKPTRVIANGVDVEAVTPVPPPPSGERPSLLFLAGSDSPWHGMDKLIQMALALPDVDFSVVGRRPEDLPGAPSNVVSHGPMSPAEYEPLAARADVAVASLAMYRADLEEACPLKVREYLALGLPTILGFEDTDFIDTDPWYLLRLPNTDWDPAVEAPRIRSFIEGVRGRRVARQEVKPRIDYAAKEAKRLSFFQDVRRSQRASSPAAAEAP